MGPRSDIGPGRGFGLAKDAVRGWLKRFSTEKTHTPQGTDLARQGPVNEAVKHPSGRKIDRERAGECLRTFAGFVAHEATLPHAVGSSWRKTLYVVGSNAFRRKNPYPPGNSSGKAKVISTASNFRMSAAPINSYPGTYAGAPLFCNYNGRSKEGIDFLGF